MNAIETLSGDFVSIVESAKDRVVCVGAGKAQPRTGFLLGDGEVVTVAHVAEAGEKVPVHVRGEESEATVAGFDPASGIALLRLDGEAGKASAIDPEELGEIPPVGALNVTVAYPIPEGHEARLGMIRCIGGQTRTPGGRKIDRYFQTDSNRFRGFSGSVVYSVSGSPIGMTMPVGRREEGFAIPMKELLAVVAQLREGGALGTGYLGVQATSVDLPEERGGLTSGLLITGVETESPADRAGLHVGSFIVTVGGTPTPDLESLYDALSGLREGSELTLGIVQGGGDIENVSVNVTLRKR